MPQDDKDDKDDDLFPSLSMIFSNPTLVKDLSLEIEEKENFGGSARKRVKRDEQSKHDQCKPALSVNTAVFVADKYNGGHCPAIITEKDDQEIYSVKFYDGRIEKLARRFIYSPDDKEFYSIITVPLKTVLTSKNSLIRPFNKKSILRLVDDYKDDLIKIIKGEIECERDTFFRSGIQMRSSLNKENALGPFTLAEYNFLLEFIPDKFIPEVVLKEFRDVLEERFEKTGKSLDHLLRQYAYLVLVPELTIRHILKIDKTVKSLKEADHKLLNNSSEYDQQTGNFINYLYSKQEMYQYARRERKG